MAPSRSSRPSSPPDRPPVNPSGPGERPLRHRQLLRRIRRTEAAVRAYRPTLHHEQQPPDEPDHADEALAALASRYRPGDAASAADISRVIDIEYWRAVEIRRWAIAVGAWPYIDPSPVRPSWLAHRSPKPSPAKGGK